VVSSVFLKLKRYAQITCKDTSGFTGEVDEVKLQYDKLVVAVGAVNNTFNTPGVPQVFFLSVFLSFSCVWRVYLI
jgi:NADH dehydrogenase FAD-containing subunit